MKLIVISPPENIPNEKETIISLFENGLEIFHIHKPSLSNEELQNYIRQIPWKFRDRIFLHEDFLKFHSLQELNSCKKEYEYAFLSPIFDSISKENYKSKLDLSELEQIVEGKKIIALGGIDEDKIETVREIGFFGVAVLGAIWQSENPVGKFKNIQTLCHSELVSESHKMLKQVQHD